mgnify:CR=1 FL=1|tara:strand:+ start:506 stop:1603 length:1098 start_codon:yes stop_codon:yes gene_type:complete
MPNTRPRIVFSKDGICNACLHSKKKAKIDWKKRENEFLQLVDNIKKFSSDNGSLYDCVIPWSGGKDSTSIALKLKFNFDLNPLLVTFSPLMVNQIGSYNRNELIKKGFDAIFISPNQNVAKKLSKRFFIERGNPKVAWDAGVNAGPVKVALNYKIPFVFYAEHGESEYGGLVLDQNSEKKRDLREVIEHQVGDFPQNWASDEILEKDLAPYIYPDPSELENINLTSFYFSYFFKWSMLDNFHYVSKMLPSFKLDENKRTQGTFTNFDSLDDKIDSLYYYMQYIKFGFGRATRDSCRMIQNNQMQRKEAISLARKYDSEFPSKNFIEVLDYLDLSEEEFTSIVNKHRNHEIWKMGLNNKWGLINTI